MTENWKHLDTLLDAFVERVAQSLLKMMLPRIEASLKVQPRWLSIESAGAYIDKTYSGMRYTLTQFPREIPVVMIGDTPRIDIKDIDTFMLNRKRR